MQDESFKITYKLDKAAVRSHQAVEIMLCPFPEKWPHTSHPGGRQGVGDGGMTSQLEDCICRIMTINNLADI